MTFPRDEGQIPIYYNHFITGRPSINEDKIYKSTYIDLPNSPKFPFGFGLSYTTFQYSNLKLSTNKINSSETIEVSFNVTNSGKFAGEEVTQLYLRDKVGSVIRPIKELKDFEKIKLQVGETKTIKFTIDSTKISFYNDNLDYISEPGEFELMIGSSSEDIRLTSRFEVVK